MQPERSLSPATHDRTTSLKKKGLRLPEGCLKVLAKASAEGRVVITFDKDYGALVFRHRLPAPAGVVLLRIQPKSVGYILDRVLRVLKSDVPLANRFTVVSETRIRSIPVRRA